MSPGAHIEAKPGERILDLCAAPGGKTTQIAAGMQGEGLLISNEIHTARAKILAENVERMGIRNAIVTNESPDRLAGLFLNYFDKIMVDAPCSGEGMFRKTPEARDEWSVENVMLCAKRQLEILNCAAEMLKAGGRIVYSTCTFSKEENEDVIEAFCEGHEEFQLITKGRLFPHKVQGEGHFYAVLEKQGTLQKSDVQKKEVSFKGYKDCEEFIKQNIRCPLYGTVVNFGDTLNLLPPGAPSLQGMKVLRAGLQLGTLKKNRFEPSHALALALRPDEVMHVVNLSIDSPEIYDFINGETFEYQGEKGWYLICVEGYSIGWGKLAGGVMKNHYPKGLRKNLR
jgi:NOL1/NOP2/fmu family ribosome biogenesis protein/23S rRNA U2552 (ribose-2'-O)-methylase RlmE/FtsJ